MYSPNLKGIWHLLAVIWMAVAIGALITHSSAAPTAAIISLALSALSANSK